MRRLLAALTLAAVGFGISAPANAGDNLNNKIQQIGEDLDNANAQVKAAMKQWRAAAADLPAAERKLAAAKAVLAAAQSADGKAALELQHATTATVKAETRLEATKGEIGQQELQVSQLVRTMYIQGPSSELAMMLGADDPGEFTQRVATIARWNTSKQFLIASLSKAREDLSTQTAQLQELKSQKEAKKQDAAAKVLTAKQAAEAARAAQSKVDKLVASKASALKIAMKNRDAVAKRYKALKAEQLRLKRLAQGIDDSGVTGGSNLLWPIPGAKVTQYTGWRTHPVYGYRSCHTGIDLGAGYGTPIKVAESGKVVNVGYGGPYGRYTLVAHGDGLTTFYAHQSAQLVREGEIVARGDVIGKVGSTGWSTGAHLHFEVREKGTPYDPMGWFGHSKRKVECVD